MRHSLVIIILLFVIVFIITIFAQQVPSLDPNTSSFPPHPTLSPTLTNEPTYEDLIKIPAIAPNVTSITRQNSTAIITWADVGIDQELDYYNIYRRDSSGIHRLIGSTTEIIFIDPDPPAGDLTGVYQITTVTIHGIEGESTLQMIGPSSVGRWWVYR